VSLHGIHSLVITYSSDRQFVIFLWLFNQGHIFFSFNFGQIKKKRVLVFLRNHQHWKKVKGMVLLSKASPIYFSNHIAEDWQQMETLVAFPLEDGETIETAFIKFVEYDLNARQTFELCIKAVRDVEIID
jgi:hypothetical protein